MAIADFYENAGPRPESHPFSRSCEGFVAVATRATDNRNGTDEISAYLSLYNTCSSIRKAPRKAGLSGKVNTYRYHGVNLSVYVVDVMQL